MADYAVKVWNEGARLIGGCCGSTPDHIKAMAEVLSKIALSRLQQRSLLKESTMPNVTLIYGPEIKTVQAEEGTLIGDVIAPPDSFWNNLVLAKEPAGNAKFL